MTSEEAFCKPDVAVFNSGLTKGYKTAMSKAKRNIQELYLQRGENKYYSKS
jgi:hypothetical protein